MAMGMRMIFGIVRRRIVMMRATDQQQDADEATHLQRVAD
jgi:hypothetical protein